MSKVLKTVGQIAAITATIATVAGNPVVAAAATAVAAVASIGAQITAPKPVARGSINREIIAAEPARPCIWGRSYSGGILRHKASYGDTLKKIPNPFHWRVKVFAGVGPVNSLVQEQFDFKPIGSYYTGFYSSVSQLGLRPESAALVPPLDAPAPGWNASSKLSGCAAIGSNYKFDKDGEVFAAGRPVHGAIWEGAKVYDPRLDDTRTGGVGTHRVDDDDTWAYSTNPALCAGTYAYGWYENDILFYGVGVPDDGIDWEAIAAWANDCDANSWAISGVTFEGGDPSEKVANLDDICAAGGGRWVTAGALLSLDWHRPRVSLATITDADVLEAGGEIVPLQSLRDRFNTVRPQYTSETHNWEQITADAIVGSTYKTEDGQELVQTWPLNLVADNGQAGQLATYAMADSREIGPVTLTLGPSWRFYKPGETLTFNSTILNFNRDLVILTKSLNPGTLEVTFTFKTETAAKHAYALGETAVAPPTPVIGQTAEERDAVVSSVIEPRGAYRIRTYVPAYPVSANDTEITILAFDGTLEDGRTISFPAATSPTLTSNTFYAVFWDLIDENYQYAIAPGVTQMESKRYVYVASQSTSSGGTYPTGSTAPDGSTYDPNQQPV